MVITGSFEAFKEFIAHDPQGKFATFCYTKTPQGRVASILVDSNLEWRFPANENVQVEFVRDFATAAIEVVSFTL